MDRVFAALIIVLVINQVLSAQLIGSFPQGGGKMSIETTDGPIQVGGLEFQADAGILTQGSSPAPFAFFIPNSANPGNVTFGVLGVPITIDGIVELDMTVSDTATGSDIVGTWGDDITPRQFPINGILADNNVNPLLSASIPSGGGPVSIFPRNDDPVTMQRLSLQAQSGSFTGGSDPAPFDTLVTSSSSLWVANSAANVTIDGDVTLDLLASFDTSISGTWFGENDNSLGSFFVRAAPPEFSTALQGISRREGPISIRSTDEPINLRGLDIRSSRSALSSTGDPSPFASLDDNSTDRWSVSSSTDVLIDGAVTLDVQTSDNREVEAYYFDGTRSFEFGIEPRTQVQSLIGSFPFDGGPISIRPFNSNNPVSVFGVSLTATAGTLTGGGSAAPFNTLSNNTPTQWSADSNAPITLDGSVVLDVEASSDAQLSGEWSDGFGTNSLSLLPVAPPFSSDLRATFPSDGGHITLTSNRQPFSARTVELTARSGELTGGGSAAPFEAITENSSSRWAAESNVAITIDGSVTLDVYASANAGIDGLVRDDGNNPRRIAVTGQTQSLAGSFDFDGGPITIRSVGNPVATRGLNLNAISGSLAGGGSPAPYDTLAANTASEWSVNSSAFVTIDGSVTLDVVASGNANINGEFSDGLNVRPFTLTRNQPGLTTQLIGSFPFAGGPVSVESVNAPFVTRGLDFTATQGIISSGGSAGPYESVTNNTVSRWTVNSSVDVTIDGKIELDLMASEDTSFDAFVTNASVTNSFDVRRDAPVIGDSPLIGTFPPEGGNITLTTIDGPIDAGGIEFIADPGELTQGASPAPFAFFIPNSAAPGNVTLGVLGTPTTLDGSVELDVFARGDAEITAFWGEGVTPRPFPVSNRPFVDGSESALIGSVPFDGGTLTLAPNNDPVITRGLNIEAMTGTLTGGGSAAPYDSLVTNTAETWVVESSADVTIDGPVELDVVVSKAAQLNGFATTNDGINAISFVQDAPESTDQIFGSYASGGGPISIVAPNGPVSTRSLDLRAPTTSTSSLIAGGSAAPYEQVVTATGNRWTATSTVDVVIDGVVTLDVEVSNTPFEIIQGLVSDGTTASSFAVRERAALTGLSASFPFDGGPVTLLGSGQQISNIDMTTIVGTLTGGGDAAPFSLLAENTNQRWAAESTVDVMIDGSVTLDVLASADAQITASVGSDFETESIFVRRLGPQFSTALVGNYDVGGGPVSLTADSPVSIRTLEISATQGALTAGADPAPFNSVVDNSSERWSVESTANVAIDGTIQLSVEAAQGSVLNGLYNDGSETFAFSVLRSGFDFGGAITAVYPAEGGRLTLISNGGIDLGGVEFVAEPGVLTQGASAAPFAFFIPNLAAPGNVTLGVLGTPVTIDGPVELDIFVAAGTPLGAISANFGGGIVPTSFNVFPLTQVPEPSSNLLVCLGLIGLLTVRRRKR